MPQDPAAAKLSLTNRRSEQWRDKTYNEHAGKDGAQREAFQTEATAALFGGGRKRQRAQAVDRVRQTRVSRTK